GIRDRNVTGVQTCALPICYDPEIPVNIVDLGLIYDCHLTPIGADNFKADVKMTLTAPGCGMGPMLAQDVQSKLLNLEPIDEANEIGRASCRERVWSEEVEE